MLPSITGRSTTSAAAEEHEHVQLAERGRCREGDACALRTVRPTLLEKKELRVRHKQSKESSGCTPGVAVKYWR